MTENARRLACRIVHEAALGGPTLADRLAAPAVEALDTRDRDFLHELVLGTLRRRGAIDFALSQASDRPLERLDPPVLAALRVGAYQLLHTRVPPRAAVFEAVAMTREIAPRAVGFANAVLRHLTRNAAPQFPSADADPLGWLTSEGSLPPWLAARWLRQLGPKAAVARARAFLDPAPTFFRTNPRAPDAEQQLREASVESEPGAVPSVRRLVSGRLRPFTTSGSVYIQDEGSQIVAHVASARGWILDACAAPGGKALLLGDLCPDSRVVAIDRDARRLNATRANLKRWRSTNVFIVGSDAAHPPLARSFDSVLLDAPCSGLGTLARRPDLRWRAQEKDLARHAKIQRGLLDSVAALVKPDGRLIYSTCSLEPEETEQVVESWRSDNTEFSEAPVPAWAQPFAEGAFLRLRPELRGGDGFFVAVFERRGRA